MNLFAREAYLETQITTATPQRLRLMLIDGALRRARTAIQAWDEGRDSDAIAAVAHCREIIAELIGGIQPDSSPLAQQVLGIYLFLFSTTAEAQFARDPHRIKEVIRVLEEEQLTWQAVCEQLPDRPAPLPQGAREELAPQRVDSGWNSTYRPAAVVERPPQINEAFSIDA